MTDGVAHETCRAVNIELAHQPRAVRVRGLGTDAEDRGALLGRVALGDEFEYLTLAHAE